MTRMRSAYKSTAGNALQAGVHLICEDLRLEDEDIWDLEIPDHERQEIMRIFMNAMERAELLKIQRHVEWLTSRGYAVRKEEEDGN